MTAVDAILLLAAFVGGVLNSVAGGGSFFTFPALVFAGVPPIAANATSTVALWPGSLASGLAYRQEVRRLGGGLGWYLGASAVGGALGALLLVHTPAQAFSRLVPFLLLAATALFTFGPALLARLSGRAHRATPAPAWVGAWAQLPIALYGGYFGGGMGLVMLAAYTVLGFTDLHQMNGLKAATAVLINAAAVGTFVLAELVVWRQGLWMTVGASAGGYLGAVLAKRMPQAVVRRFVAAVGWALTAYFFWRGGA
jgi:uncharacterized protein